MTGFLQFVGGPLSFVDPWFELSQLKDEVILAFNLSKTIRQRYYRLLHLLKMRTFGEFATPANQLYRAPNYRNPLDEHELIRGCLRGSAQCQRDLYERFAGKMYAVCLRYARTREDAADILQEGFLKVFTKLEQFQFQGSFEGWVRRVMVNTALRAYQKQRFEFEQTGYERLPEMPVDPDALAMLSETELLNLVRHLPDGYRAVFNLVAIEGYSHAEAATLLGIQESTSRSQLTKARRHLEVEVGKLERILL